MHRQSAKSKTIHAKSNQQPTTKHSIIKSTSKISKNLKKPQHQITKIKRSLSISPIQTIHQPGTSPSNSTPQFSEIPLVTTTVTDPGGVSFETSFQGCIDEVQRNTPYHSTQIHLLPVNQRAISLGLRALQCELDAIPEKAKKQDIAYLKASFWRSSAEKMRIWIINESLIQQYGEDSAEIRAFRRDIKIIEPPAPLAPIKTLTHAIAHNGVGFDFLLLDNMISGYGDYFPGNSFSDLPHYIQTVDQTCGSLNLLQITTGAHEIQNLEEIQPLSKGIAQAAIQLGRVEGLLRLLTHQPLTFANNYTWLPRDLLRQNGVDPAHFVTVGKDLLEHSNKEWLDGFTKGNLPNLQIRADISHEFQDDLGEEELERELMKLRASDPNRSEEGLNTTVPAHLRDIKTISMKQLREGLRETNKVLYNVTMEQLTKLRDMQKDVPKPLRVYFFHTYAVDSYLQRLKEADYDTLDPQLHIWDHKTMLKLNITMAWNNLVGKY